MLGAGPLQPGSELAFGAGLGVWEHEVNHPEEAEPRGYQITEPLGHLRYDRVETEGFQFSFEGSLGIGEATPQATSTGELSPDLTSTLWSGAFAARAGWTWPRVGLSGGPAAAFDPRRQSGLRFLPSIEVWGGRPDRVYFWGSFLGGPQGGARELWPMAGIGHRSRWIWASFGTNGMSWQSDVDLHVGPGFRLGLQAAGGDADPLTERSDLRGLLRLTIVYRELRTIPPPPG
jgi:hypothetical protein